MCFILKNAYITCHEVIECVIKLCSSSNGAILCIGAELLIDAMLGQNEDKDGVTYVLVKVDLSTMLNSQTVFSTHIRHMCKTDQNVTNDWSTKNEESSDDSETDEEIYQQTYVYTQRNVIMWPYEFVYVWV